MVCAGGRDHADCNSGRSSGSACRSETGCEEAGCFHDKETGDKERAEKVRVSCCKSKAPAREPFYFPSILRFAPVEEEWRVTQSEVPVIHCFLTIEFSKNAGSSALFFR